jgi:SLOG-like protein
MSATSDCIFAIDRMSNTLLDAAGRRFDPEQRTWLPASRKKARSGKAEMMDAIAAVGWLQRESSYPLREPIGVVGPRQATAAQLAAALKVGELLGDCRLTVLCGGRQGVMQAVCEGEARVGGLSIGLLPEAMRGRRIPSSAWPSPPASGKRATR